MSRAVAALLYSRPWRMIAPCVLVVADPRAGRRARRRCSSSRCRTGTVDVLVSSTAATTRSTCSRRAARTWCVITATLEVGDARSLIEALREMVPRARGRRSSLIGDDDGPIRTALDALELAPDRFVTRPLSAKALRFAVRRASRRSALARGPCLASTDQAPARSSAVGRRASRSSRRRASTLPGRPRAVAGEARRRAAPRCARAGGARRLDRQSRIATVTLDDADREPTREAATTSTRRAAATADRDPTRARGTDPDVAAGQHVGAARAEYRTPTCEPPVREPTLIIRPEPSAQRREPADADPPPRRTESADRARATSERGPSRWPLAELADRSAATRATTRGARRRARRLRRRHHRRSSPPTPPPMRDPRRRAAHARRPRRSEPLTTCRRADGDRRAGRPRLRAPAAREDVDDGAAAVPGRRARRQPAVDVSRRATITTPRSIWPRSARSRALDARRHRDRRGRRARSDARELDDLARHRGTRRSASAACPIPARSCAACPMPRCCSRRCSRRASTGRHRVPQGRRREGRVLRSGPPGVRVVERAARSHGRAARARGQDHGGAVRAVPDACRRVGAADGRDPRRLRLPQAPRAAARGAPPRRGHHLLAVRLGPRPRITSRSTPTPSARADPAVAPSRVADPRGHPPQARSHERSSGCRPGVDGDRGARSRAARRHHQHSATSRPRSAPRSPRSTARPISRRSRARRASTSPTCCRSRGACACSASRPRAAPRPRCPRNRRALVGETDLAIDRERVRARWQLVTEADYFALLGVRRDATGFEIRRAYQSARRDFAADCFPNDLRRELARELDDIAQRARRGVPRAARRPPAADLPLEPDRAVDRDGRSQPCASSSWARPSSRCRACARSPAAHEVALVVSPARQAGGPRRPAHRAGRSRSPRWSSGCR